MKKSRRSFIKRMGLSGLAAGTIPATLSAGCSGSGREIRIAENSVVLFQGDSITDGNRGRNNDPNHIMGHGYAFGIASRLGSAFPEKNLRFLNRGISGNTVLDLAERWEQDCLNLKPDILSILIGVNDCCSVIQDWDNPVSTETFEKTLDRLLVQTRDSHRRCRLVLCEPFLLKVGWIAENWEIYRQDIVKRQIIVRTLAGKHNAVFVEFQQAFDEACKKAPAEYWIWDGIHPTVAGHGLMVHAWLDTLRKAEYL